MLKKSREEFLALDEDEQLEWLGYDEYLGRKYEEIRKGLQYREDGQLYVKDMGASVDLIVERL